MKKLNGFSALNENHETSDLTGIAWGIQERRDGNDVDVTLDFCVDYSVGEIALGNIHNFYAFLGYILC